MGFNKKHLPPIDKMKEARKNYDTDLDFLENYIGKYDCLIGSRESIDYLYELEKGQKECQD
jgi:hypothetical protein